MSESYSLTSASGVLLSEVSTAANLNSGSNPAYTTSDFTTDFPQFNSAAVPDSLLQKFIGMANASLSYSKYNDVWSYCMGLYVAHFCALLAKSMKNGDAAGVQSAKSVGDVSVSYDTDAIASDLNGFSTFKATIYGQQLATFAKMAGTGGMTAW